MNAVDMAQMAYGSSTAPLRTSRGNEYDVFAEATRRLKSADSGVPGNISALAQAIHDNRRLWTALAMDVADAGNPLPRSLRARIFYLHEFVDAHSRRVLRGEATTDVLIDINVAIMRGLGVEGCAA
ncbi:flagellar biosynthesis regulator FlaF [Tropicimonas sp. IMCC34043]|uniref:flagellar biosynthesis regulator FlaF n=1 Tax=Tropicimonas sp. IMCC34043 TaxID=2248760 RepID=UPI000E266CFB|nr:flagellar biosynthesis regulator FlaF [Tropicimonas sp. IMCC34043]